MRPRLSRWLVAYAAATTLLALWCGSRLVIAQALLARTSRFLVSQPDQLSYHYNPDVLAERGFVYCCLILIDRISPALLLVAIGLICLIAWKLPTDTRPGEKSYRDVERDF